MQAQNQKTLLKHDAPSARELATEIAEAARFARKHAIASIYHAGSGHPGGAMSSADILACLFGAELNFWSDAVNDPDRDRFVLSKGHGAPALYAIAAHYGFCDARAALNLRKLGSPFQGHPHVLDLPWVETSTGSLGQGFSVALGMAMGLKLQRKPAPRLHASGRRRIAGRRSVGSRDVRRPSQARQSLRHHRLQQAAKRRPQRRDHAAGAARREMARLRLGRGRNRRTRHRRDPVGVPPRSASRMVGPP